MPGGRSSGQRAQWIASGLMAWLVLVFFSVAALHTDAGPRLDARLAAPLIHGPPWWLRESLSELARPWLIVAAGALAGVLLLWALAQRRILAVLTALVITAGSLCWLRELRAGWLDLGSAAFPSGHTVAGLAALVAVAVLWPAPPRRWLVLVWSLAVVVILVGNITLHAHQPSDVIAAALLVSAVSGVSIGTLAPRPVRGPTG